MLLFLFRLTGMAFTERQALKSRGDDYRAYQRETNPIDEYRYSNCLALPRCADNPSY